MKERVNIFRTDFCQGLKDEGTFVHPGVRDLQFVFGDNLVFVKEDIEVDQTRPPAGRVNTSHIILDFFEPPEKSTRVEVGLYLHGHIDKAGLICLPPWFRFVLGRLLQHSLPGLVQECYGLEAVGLPVAQVGTNAYIYPCHEKAR